MAEFPQKKCFYSSLGVNVYLPALLYDLDICALNETEIASFAIVTSCRRAAATIYPRPSPPSVGAEAPRAAEPTVPAHRNVAVGSHGQYVPTLTAAAA